MKIFKRLVIFLLILVVLLIGTAIAIPFLFKDKIEAAVKAEVNANINAKVDWGEWDLTILKSFPDLTAVIENVKVGGLEPFDGVELANIKQLELTVDIMSVLGDRIDLKKVGLIEPQLDIRVLADGRANYDIAKEDSTATDAAAAEESKFNVGLRKYWIENGTLHYDDATMPFHLELNGFDHEGKGDFTQDLFTLETTTKAASTEVVYDGVRYLSGSKVDMKADLDMDINNMKFTFKENKLNLDRLGLAFNGWVSMPADDIDMDITWATDKNDLASILSLVPAAFAKDLDGVDMTGKSDFSGYVKGTYNDNMMPGFGVNIKIENGRFKYPDLPSAVEDIQLICDIKSPQGKDLDGMVVDIPKFHLSLAGQPVDAKLHLTHPISDPNIDASLKAKLDLGKVTEVVPMEGDARLQGIVDADVTLKGRMSAIEQERYNDFQAFGNATIRGMEYTSRTTGYLVTIDEMVMDFDPRFVDMKNFTGKLGGSDLQSTGRVDNYLGWYLKDEPLTGRFTLRSNKFDMNELMGSEEEASASAEGTPAPADSTMAAFEVPPNLDVELTADIKELLFDDLVLTNVNGKIGIKESMVDMRNVKFNMFGGDLAMNGTYGTKNPKRPTIDLDYDIKMMDIQQTAKYVNSVQAIAPIAMSCLGKFSTSMSMKGEMNENMDFIYSTLNGLGTLKTHGVTIEKFRPLTKIATTLKIDALSEPKIQDCNFTFKLRDGKMVTDPFNVKIDQVMANVGGSTTFEDNAIDYLLKTTIPTKLLGGGANDLANNLLGQMNQKLGSNISIGDEMKVDIQLTGTVDDPKVKPVWAGQQGQKLQDVVKEEVKQLITNEVKDLKNDALIEAQKQADKLMAEANKQAQSIRDGAAQAAQKVKDEGYAQAQKLIDDAKNPLAKAGAKVASDQLRKETDKQAQNLITEGDRKADGVVNTAKQQSDALIQKAQATGP